MPEPRPAGRRSCGMREGEHVCMVTIARFQWNVNGSDVTTVRTGLCQAAKSTNHALVSVLMIY